MNGKRDLSSDQIEHLFEFVRSKYVRYTDVQFELVDHLASAIEDELEQDHNSSFEEALKNVYKRFLVTGFSKLVSSKENELSLSWMKIRMMYLLKYLYTYRVFIFLPCLLLSYFMILYGQIIGIGLLVFITIILEYYTIKWNKEMIISSPYRQYLAFTSFGFYNPMSLSIMVVLTIQLVIDKSFDTFYFTNWMSVIMALLFSINFIRIHAYLTSFTDLVIKEIKLKYPKVQ